ncbi:hypothetical protein WJX72_008308 [[Myrmecia] bisecta]|uniref:Pentatricopeptide repeat-containing protein n=1 Tax=[Myrmecia] bisecta TaxID=41462 RepID=A0AAW1PS96_9CHLO
MLNGSTALLEALLLRHQQPQKWSCWFDKIRSASTFSRPCASPARPVTAAAAAGRLRTNELNHQLSNGPVQLPEEPQRARGQDSKLELPDHKRAVTALTRHSKAGGVGACLAYLRRQSTALTFSYNYLLSHLHSEASQQILAAMEAQGVRPDAYTTVQAITHAKTADQAWQWYTRHVDAGMVPNGFVISALCSAFGREGQPHVIRDIMSQAIGMGLRPPSHCYSSLVQAYGRCKNLGAARNVIDEMWRAELKPTDDVFAALITCYGSLSRATQAREVLQMMLDMDVKPGIKSYSALVNAYANARMPEQASALIQEMQDEGIQPNIMSWNALLKAWSRVSDVGQIRATMGEMLRHNIPLDGWAWCSLINAYGVARQPAKARETLAEMCALGYKPNVVVWTALITAYAEVADLAGARAVLHEMLRAGIQPNGITYTNLMTCAARAGDHSACQAIMQEMAAAGLAIDNVAHLVLIEAAMQHWQDSGRPAEVLREAQRLFRHSQVPRMPVHWAQGGQAWKFGRAGKGAVLDLHTYNHWTAQLALLSALQRLLEKRQQNPKEPRSDLRVVAGRGKRSVARGQPVIREVAVRFLQGLLPVSLDPENEGLVVVRRKPLIDLLDHFIQHSYTFDAITLQHNFVAK